MSKSYKWDSFVSSSMFSLTEKKNIERFILILHVTSGEYFMKFATHSALNVLITIIFGTTKTCDAME
jgi:hypothetical protein